MSKKASNFLKMLFQINMILLIIINY